MKLILTLLIILTFTGSTLAQLDSLAGTWQVNLAQTISEMSSTDQAAYNNLPDQAKQNLSRSFDGRKYKFLNNGTAVVSWQGASGPIEQTGTWVTSGSNELKITIGPHERVFNIDLHTTDKLVFSMDDTPQSAILKKLVLIKVTP